MAKTYDHAVIYNGVFYPANTPIEEEKAVNENADNRASGKSKVRNKAD